MLTANQIPAHTQVAFGRDNTATTTDYVSWTYTTGDIAPVSVTGVVSGKAYKVYRSSIAFYGNHNPTSGAYTLTCPAGNGNWCNSLSLAPLSGEAAWAFSPLNDFSTAYRGYAMDGIATFMGADAYAWTVWVRYLQLLSRVLGESSAASHLLVQDPPPPRRLPVILTQTRERELTDHLPNCTQRQQLLVALVLGAGLRAGEVAQVRWSDLRLDDPALPWLVARRRSGEPIRSTPVAPWAVPYIQAALPVESAREAYVFANERGLPVAASTLWRDCEALVSQVLGPAAWRV